MALDTITRAKLEAAENWRSVDIPELEFPAGWKVKLIPPFGGAMARFVATNTHGSEVSVYFDAHHALGYFGSALDKPEPYWEAYPVGKAEPLVSDPDDPERFAAHETKELIEFIGRIGDPAYAAMHAFGVLDVD